MFGRWMGCGRAADKRPSFLYHRSTNTFIYQGSRMSLFHYEKMLHDFRREDLTLQVVEKGEMRQMRFGNHIVQSAMSMRYPDLLQLDYTRTMAFGAMLAPRLGRFLHIGLGGGSLVRFFHMHLSGLNQQVVELNQEVVEASYHYFDLPRSPRLEVTVMDGAEFVRQNTGRYDAIFLDAFHASGAVDHMNTQTLYAQLHQRLEPRGWLISNAWGSDRRKLYEIRGNILSAFPQVYSLSVRAESNVIFFAGRDDYPLNPQRLKGRARMLKGKMPLDMESMLDRLKTDKSPGRPDNKNERIIQ